MILVQHPLSRVDNVVITYFTLFINKLLLQGKSVKIY